jgi:hypothetical protein
MYHILFYEVISCFIPSVPTRERKEKDNEISDTGIDALIRMGIEKQICGNYKEDGYIQ